MEPLFHGMILAFGLILPLGVQNVFVFNQGATHKKFINALPAIITAGVCDTILIYLAVAGVSIIVFSFEWLKILLFLVGFFFLAYMGWIMWKNTPEINANQERDRFSARRQVAFAASVSLLNPHAIMDTIGVIGTSSLAYTGYEKWVFTVACIMISWIWFFSLAISGRKIGQFDKNGQFLKHMNQASALIIWAMAIYMGYQVYSLLR
ncbi:L-lysine exporter family protein LysE/ArgO [Cytobacillus firmus]|uniref:L-lysine exporter family protein LysE/ArgO n=2 Tax=Cytobacillus TaxID=2675230 RepID=A0A366K0H2_CYTFI|nr:MULTISPECIES: LysE/ArgO family amino acid transporter [Cytobacillus]RBP94747.1 L-lysine exporter family protein LysE/ArgO [Cytobacillus firmus]TDX43492.1 L-lysine exporter family protein LysE/ArgO [Cytobacillus oceanisediminis]